MVPLQTCPFTIPQGLRTTPRLEGAGIIAGMWGVPFSSCGRKLDLSTVNDFTVCKTERGEIVLM